MENNIVYLSKKIQQIFDSFSHLIQHTLQNEPPYITSSFLNNVTKRLREGGLEAPVPTHSPYLNTIPPEEQPVYPGDREIERKIKSIIRWNAMAMVVKANRDHPGIGGHISTYASCATLYEVGFNHFFHAGNEERYPDPVYFQGHASPGNYARAYVEYRMDAGHLHHFRQDLAGENGLSSYPHPYLMPEFWQFPTVSMGLAPITSIYQARFMRYMLNRNLLQKQEPTIWSFVGDGEFDEPETTGAITLAGREHLDNLIWVLNCNLQRLDGPVRGNSKFIQEAEAIFRGAGWNVIKVIWGRGWDELLEKDSHGLLKKRMEEATDGEFQKYSVEPGSYARKHFFGKYPELLDMVNHLSDADITKLMRGGHDPEKVYAAYKAAVEHTGQPTVILAKTIKGYGLGEAGEGRNITHQQKKLNEKELREFRQRFNIPIQDEDIAETPFYRPPKNSPEVDYLTEQRRKLGGYLPKREDNDLSLQTPHLEFFSDFTQPAADQSASTTMALVRMIRQLLSNKDIGKYVVPLIPDEARTFGMDALFRQFGIYSPWGQLYEPVDIESLLYYQESKDGQILEEGITEAGSMSSFVAAGTAYANLGIPMIPLYTFYSMFGFQRVGDLIWLAGDAQAKGFLFGATAGRTTLSGEGLQHQDGHSHLMASSVPNLMAYDPAFAYEIAVLVQDGIRRMYQNNENIFYYITLYNENYPQPKMPHGVEDGIKRGLYKFKKAFKGKKKAHIFGSGPMMNEALHAQEILGERFDVAADVWSATSYKLLRTDALKTQRWNMLHPEAKPRRSYLETILGNEEGVFIAVSDNMKLVPDQIAPWVPGGLLSLGTDGFGRSDTRPNLRRFFEIDAEMVVLAVLYQLARQGKIEKKEMSRAIDELGIDSEKAFAHIV
ncbi:pyruvate dehydrogenase (acetyl-transferring), homodimeric type [bacterium]|nr:pyruvate dehydrogenase (acetyl-transferring), homodimeric type [bacterium]